MKKIIRGISLLLSLICCFALFSCVGAEPDYKRSYNTNAGLLTFDVPLGDREAAKWEEELESFARTFDSAYLKLTDVSTGLLSEINTPEINAVLDCSAEEVAFYSEMYQRCTDSGIKPLSAGEITFEGTSVRLTDKNATLDFSAVAVPYAVEQTVKAFGEAGYNDGLVTIGGFCAVLGLKDGDEAYHIGIPKEVKTEGDEEIITYYGYLSVTDGYLSISECEEGEIEKAVVYCADPICAQIISEKLAKMTERGAEDYYTECRTRYEAAYIIDGRVITTKGLESTSIFTEETTAETTTK